MVCCRWLWQTGQQIKWNILRYNWHDDCSLVWIRFWRWLVLVCMALKVLLLHFLLISWVHSGWAASKLEQRNPPLKKVRGCQGMLPNCEMKWSRNFPLRKVFPCWLFHHPVETIHFLCCVLFFMDLWTKMFGALCSIRPLNFKIWWHFLASTFPRVGQPQKFYCGVCNVYATQPCCTKELKGNCRY